MESWEGVHARRNRTEPQPCQLDQSIIIKYGMNFLWNGGKCTNLWYNEMDLKSQNFQDYSIASGGITMISKENESRIDRFISENRQNIVMILLPWSTSRASAPRATTRTHHSERAATRFWTRRLSCARAWALQPKTMITMQALLFMATQKRNCNAGPSGRCSGGRGLEP